MRITTFECDGQQSLGVILEDRVLDLAKSARNSGQDAGLFANMQTFLEAGERATSLAGSLAENGRNRPESYALQSVKLRAPVPRPGKIVAIGLNYRDHSIEQGVTPPSAPLLFAKFPTSIAGPGDQIVIPEGDPQVDYEAELAVIIGRRCKRATVSDAMENVAGYMALNDVSARRWQFADKQWVRGKSCDTFCPIGPWLTTRDEIADPHTLNICTRVNGVTLQDSNTRLLIFRIPELVAYISASITLEPGDIIATGTPEGVGVFRKPPIFLKTGDVVEIEIEKLGVLTNPVTAAASR
jgi:2-keto-4-pentenoate hydratase/2-oxohepta-3-ene-1,7-dioic acid hydratase in catechol pathway